MQGTVSDRCKLCAPLLSGFWEQLGQNRNRIVKNSRISGHPEPDIRYIPNLSSEGNKVTCSPMP